MLKADFEEIWLEDGVVAYIFYHDNCIFILTNEKIDNETIQQKINEYIEKNQFKLTNILYAEDFNIVNIGNIFEDDETEYIDNLNEEEIRNLILEEMKNKNK